MAVKENGTLKFWSKWKVIITTIVTTLTLLSIVGSFILDTIISNKVREIIGQEFEIRLQPIIERINGIDKNLETAIRLLTRGR